MLVQCPAVELSTETSAAFCHPAAVRTNEVLPTTLSLTHFTNFKSKTVKPTFKVFETGGFPVGALVCTGSA